MDLHVSRLRAVHQGHASSSRWTASWRLSIRQICSKIAQHWPYWIHAVCCDSLHHGIRFHQGHCFSNGLHNLLCVLQSVLVSSLSRRMPSDLLNFINPATSLSCPHWLLGLIGSGENYWSCRWARQIMKDALQKLKRKQPALPSCQSCKQKKTDGEQLQCYRQLSAHVKQTKPIDNQSIVTASTMAYRFVKVGSELG